MLPYVKQDQNQTEGIARVGLYLIFEITLMSTSTFITYWTKSLESKDKVLSFHE